MSAWNRFFLSPLRVPRDQGLTRPKVLILVPFREAALRTVNTMISLLLPSGEVSSLVWSVPACSSDVQPPPQGQVSHRKRFQEEFSEPTPEPPRLPKPGNAYRVLLGDRLVTVAPPSQPFLPSLFSSSSSFSFSSLSSSSSSFSLSSLSSSSSSSLSPFSLSSFSFLPGDVCRQH